MCLGGGQYPGHPRGHGLARAPDQHLLVAVAVGQTMAGVDFLCVGDKVTILDRIISVAEEPLWPAERLSRGRRKWRLSNPYNSLGLSDSHRQTQVPRPSLPMPMREAAAPCVGPALGDNRIPGVPVDRVCRELPRAGRLVGDRRAPAQLSQKRPYVRAEEMRVDCTAASGEPASQKSSQNCGVVARWRPRVLRASVL